MRGGDDYGGPVFTLIVQGLANMVGELGFDDMKRDLKEAEFTVDHLPKEDGGPDWEKVIFNDIVESGSGNCMDVSWL